MKPSSIEILSLFINLFSAAKIFSDKRNHDIPFFWWIFHIGLCLLIGPPIPISSQSNLLISVFFVIFSIVLLDAQAKYSVPILQIFALIVTLFILFLTIGWNKIIYTPNGIWVFILTYLLYFLIPISVGMKFFSALKSQNFPALDIAFVLSADYLLLLTIGGFISKIL